MPGQASHLHSEDDKNGTSLTAVGLKTCYQLTKSSGALPYVYRYSGSINYNYLVSVSTLGTQIFRK